MNAKTIFQRASKEGRHNLLGPEAFELCDLYKIPILEWRFAKDSDDAAKIAKEIGFPVAMKVVTSELLHKREVGGVILGIRNSREVKARYNKLVDSFKGRKGLAVRGVILQAQIERALEVLIASFRDSQFGACMMMGLGGVLADLASGSTYRLVPLSEDDADSMISEVAGGKLSAELRSQNEPSRETLIRIILNLSKMMSDLVALDSVELNPVVLHEDRVVVVDAKVSLKKMI